MINFKRLYGQLALSFGGVGESSVVTEIRLKLLSVGIRNSAV